MMYFLPCINRQRPFTTYAFSTSAILDKYATKNKYGIEAQMDKFKWVKYRSWRRNWLLVLFVLCYWEQIVVDKDFGMRIVEENDPLSF